MTSQIVPPFSLYQARRIVIKIGSALLVSSKTSALREAWLASLCADVAQLRSQGCEVIIVSSGAIALARHKLGKAGIRLRLDEKQALASIGQIELVQGWQKALSGHGLMAGQLLLTQDDTESRKRHLNARATLKTLLAWGCIPVINENDTVSTGEIRFGDNDRLAARVAQMTGADILILLSDIDGLYTEDPRNNPDARHLPVVEKVTDDIMKLGGAPPPGYSSGGMRTKLMAARIANRAGAHMVIASGDHSKPLTRLVEGALCTWFLAQTDTGSARKRWIGSSLSSKGELIIDQGAEMALRKGASLLAAGITCVHGQFEQGDLVLVKNDAGKEIASGLSTYASDELRRLAGARSADMETLIGYRGKDAAIHRDDLVLSH